MEYYLTIKKKKLLIHTTIWMNLKEIILNSKTQSWKDALFHLYNICETTILELENGGY